MAVNYYQSIYGSYQFPFTIDDFKELYPLVVFDIISNVKNSRTHQ